MCFWRKSSQLITMMNESGLNCLLTSKVVEKIFSMGRKACITNETFCNLHRCQCYHIHHRHRSCHHHQSPTSSPCSVDERPTLWTHVGAYSCPPDVLVTFKMVVNQKFLLHLECLWIIFQRQKGGESSYWASLLILTWLRGGNRTLLVHTTIPTLC